MILRVLLFLLIFSGVAFAESIGTYEVTNIKRVDLQSGVGYFEIVVQYKDPQGNAVGSGKVQIQDTVIDDADGLRTQKIHRILSQKLGQFVARKRIIGETPDGSDLETIKNTPTDVQNVVVGIEAEGIILNVGQTKSVQTKLIWLDDSRTNTDNSNSIFKILDTTIATVNAQGEVTGVKSGETDIRIRNSSGSTVTRILVN